MHVSVRNFEKYQHYKTRRPPWIKLYQDLLEDYAFTRLQDASKWHAVALFLLASRYENRIPFDLAFITREVKANSPVDLDELVSAGFITLSEDASNALAARKQNLAVETEAEREIEAEETTTAPIGARVGVVRSDSANGSGTGTALIPVSSDPRTRIGAVLTGVAEGARRRGDADRERAGQAEFVFAYWALVMEHPRAIYDDKRKRRIESALRENRGDVGELLYAVDGARKTPYLMGENETRTRYDGIETVLRDRAQIEKLAAKCPAYQRGEPHPRLKELEAA
jgi:hypothetical protein